MAGLPVPQDATELTLPQSSSIPGEFLEVFWGRDGGMVSFPGFDHPYHEIPKCRGGT